MNVSCESLLDGHTNMARDIELLERAENCGCHARVYSWDGPWVSLGRFQKPERALIDHDSTSWVMRPTGGKAVLHGHDVTVGLAANLEELDLEERSIASVYRVVVGALVRALCASGVPCVLAEGTNHLRNAGHTADCFAHTSPNDVVDLQTGVKVCGCALRVTEKAVLLQASIPVGHPLVDPSRFFSTPHVPAMERDLSIQLLAEQLQTISVGRSVQPMV